MQPDVFLFWLYDIYVIFLFQFWHAVKVQTLALVEALEGVQGDGWVVDVVLVIFFVYSISIYF